MSKVNRKKQGLFGNVVPHVGIHLTDDELQWKQEPGTRFFKNLQTALGGQFGGVMKSGKSVELSGDGVVKVPINYDGSTTQGSVTYFDGTVKEFVQEINLPLSATYDLKDGTYGVICKLHTAQFSQDDLAAFNENPELLLEWYFGTKSIPSGIVKGADDKVYYPVDGYYLELGQTYTDIGTPGSIGFGVGKPPSLPAGWTALDGYDNPSSPNYGNVLDNTGSVMVWIPKFYFRWNTDNTVDIASGLLDGFQIHRAFIDGGVEKAGVFVDKYGCGNVAGVFTSKQGIDPCSTHTDHNPIADLNNTPPNRYGGLYQAVKTRSADHLLTSVFIYNALATLTHAHGKAGANCAYADVAPYHPKGNNNNGLKDIDDPSVVFTGSGYSNCALTGSGVPFAKTTHNGQECGIADLNGNMWEVTSGFIKYGTSNATFKILKESTRLADIQDDTTTQGSGGAYDIDLYDDLDLTGSMASDQSSNFGNGANQVFQMNTDRASEEYKMTTAGLPMIDGYSSGGTIEFGKDAYREYWRNQMALIGGGYWDGASAAGVFSSAVSSARDSRFVGTGGRTCCYL